MRCGASSRRCMAKNNEEMSKLDRDRIDADKAGYMELEGATKTGNCKIVFVQSGVSKELGCCNLFDPQSRKTKRFNCGNCEYVVSLKSR